MDLTFIYVDQILIYVIFAASLNLLLGYAGMFSTAHAVFGAFGGYSVAYLVNHDRGGLVIGMLVAVVLAAGLAVAIGFPALRLDLTWIILLTLALQFVVVGILGSINMFGGSYGLQLTSVPFFGRSLVTSTDLFPVVLVAAAVVFGVCWRLGESPYGRVLRGIREDEIAVRSLGKHLFTYKMTVMVLTAMMAAVAGSFLTTLYQVATPNLFGFNTVIAMISMVIIGGRGNLVGTLLGCILITLSTPFLQYVVNLDATIASLWQTVIYGLALVAVMYFRPAGLIPEGVLPRRHVSAEIASRAESTELVMPAQALETDPYPSESPAIALEVRDLSKSFGGVRAVDGLSLTLRQGAITALVGPNGAGKTTVFNLITGEIPVDQGTVFLHGRDISGVSPDTAARNGLVRTFQDVKLFPDLSAHENVILAVQGHPGELARNLFLRPRATRAFERSAAEKAYACLQFVGMQDSADARAGSLGYGEQKLVAIARILATDAEVLLLDEPASGIDHAWVEKILDLVARLRDDGKTICIVEHNLHVVDRLADHVFFMELGRVTAEGNLAELTSDKRLAEAYFGT
jgi:branched-chain amino acid transport system permease protein